MRRTYAMRSDVVTEQTGVGLSDIKDPLLFLQGFLSHTLPNARGKRSEIGEKEKNYYLFKSYID